MKLKADQTSVWGQMMWLNENKPIKGLFYVIFPTSLLQIWQSISIPNRFTFSCTYSYFQISIKMNVAGNYWGHYTPFNKDLNCIQPI